MKPFLSSTRFIEDGAELSLRMKRDGYLFIRGLLPADVLEELRLKFLEVARDSGWIKENTPLADAMANLESFCVEPEREYMEKYFAMYVTPELHALQHRPEITGLLERFTGDSILPHPRIIGRTIFPQKESFTTPPHHDFIPIQGTPDTYTAWIPLSDVPAEMGGLQIASGSHRSGVYNFRPALGAGGLAVTDPLGDNWVSNPFRQGDVLLFHSLTVHKGVPNTGTRLRMSIDARYQKITDPIAPASLLPHDQSHTWEEIYATWSNHRELKYYWKKREMETVEYDNSYHEKRDQMALALAENGDPATRSTLQRIIARDSDPAKRKRAQTLLERLDSS